MPVPIDYLQDSNIKHRLSQDRAIDSRGRERLDLCTESQIRILNDIGPSETPKACIHHTNIMVTVLLII